jgi:hypothetical protein
MIVKSKGVGRVLVGHGRGVECLGPIQWRMQDENQGGAKTMEMLICMKI